MRFDTFVSTVDSHTAGEGTRLVTGGLPPIMGQTMGEKMSYAQSHLPWVPRLLLREPRGHKDLFGAVLVEPCAPEADIGVLFMDNEKFEPACGHATIGVVTCLLEMGMFAMKEPVTELALDTPAGVLRAEASVRDASVGEVSFRNVPAFVAERDCHLHVPELGDLVVDVAFGGNFFALVDARQVNLELVPANAHRWAAIGMAILPLVNERVPVQHPDQPHIDEIIDVRFYVDVEGAVRCSRNVVVLGNHMVDRSPCGTGTCAEMALRYSRGELRLLEPWIAESLLGTVFRGCLLGETAVDLGAKVVPAVHPSIAGTAHVTGFHKLVRQPEDPFLEGFSFHA